jgi:hypothetical protein
MVRDDTSPSYFERSKKYPTLGMGKKTPSQLTPNGKKLISGGVGGGHSPPPFIVISSEAKNLLFNRKGQKSTFRTDLILVVLSVAKDRRLPYKNTKFKLKFGHSERSEESPNIRTRATPPFQLFPKRDLKFFLGVLRGILLTPSIG